MKTVIKGAMYFDGQTLLRPHFTGEFSMVDCTTYERKEEINAKYSNDIADLFLTVPPFVYDGTEYYQTEYSVFYTDEMTLISDISSIEFFDDCTEF